MTQELPTLPAALLVIVQAAGDPDVSLATIANLIMAQPTMTASVLALANSAAFNRGAKTNTVEKATLVLGARAIRNLAVTHAVRVMTSRVDAGELDEGLFWEDSLRRASCAMVLAGQAGYEDPAEAFTVGLLQDLGTLAIAVGHLDRSGELQAVMGLPAADRIVIERQIAGASHAEYLLEKGIAWGLPQDMLQVISLHHSPEHRLAERRSARLRDICAVADKVADVVQTNASGGAVAVATQAVESLTAREPLRLERILDSVAQVMESMSGDLELSIGAQPSFEELMSNANEALIQINLSYEELTRRLQQLLEEKEELTRQLRSSNAALARLAATDMLTGVANRRAFTEAVDGLLADPDEPQKPISLVMVDIDHFKAVNDTFGHAAGDDVLRGVCERMQVVVRAEDLVGRLGGEEFAILLPNCDAYHGRRVAERIRIALKKKPLSTQTGEDIRITASFGGVTLASAPFPKRDRIFKIIDTALYQAKEAGRDRVIWAD
ncbi:MAG: sensor domain-containing diguanylate cyclase [Myxococcota bacterium]